MPYGTGGWGDTEYGVGSPSDLYVVRADASSERTVVVEMSEDVVATTPIAVGDALNPASWTVEELDSSLAVVRTFMVLAVKIYLADTKFELYTLEKFARYPVTHRVTINNLRAQSGTPIGVPTNALFPGVIAGRQTADALQNVRDIRNAPFMDATAVGGTMTHGASGDYETEGGVALIKKMVIRRLVSEPNGFFHLPSTFGLGLQLKEPLLVRDMGRLKTDVERQTVQEPEVDTARARVNLLPSGTVYVTVDGKLRTGAPFTFQIEANE